MPNRSLPEDYAERVYAGVLGKVIGVYLGRPFEGWTYEKIMAELGEIDYYVHDRLGQPLLVTDDDIAGTFTFLRALPDNGDDPDLSAAQIGNTWLNYIVPERSILWWGGVGNSTEHTAFVRLQNGIAAPRSGSMQLNGQVVAEQIGAQIFIDGWAMVAPGRPQLAAELARRAGSVSHDGEAVFAAQALAAMEAQAFVESDIDALLDAGLAQIPADSLITRMVADIRGWHAKEPDWREARALLAADYGYDKYGGNCHVIPNHGLIVLALLYGAGDFDRSLMIVNTCGWDTDCNSGNLGALLGIRNGLAAFAGAHDWRGPVADRLYLSTADGGRGITDAVAETDHIVASGRALAGAAAPARTPRFHFSYPGSMQGFTVHSGAATLSNPDGSGLRVAATGRAEIMTPTFIPPEALELKGYGLVAAPTLYSGQTLHLTVTAGERPVTVAPAIRRYGPGDHLITVDGPVARLAAGEQRELSWALPDTHGNPIAAAGIVSTGEVVLRGMDWDGEPDLTLTRPEEGGTLWSRSWVDAVDSFVTGWGDPYRLIQNSGRGLILTGTRDWRDYTVTAALRPHLADATGVAVRAQGLRRYYALLLGADGALRLVKMYDGETELARTSATWELGRQYEIGLRVRGTELTGFLDGEPVLQARDSDLDCGGIALVCEVGRVGCDRVRIEPAG
ncbi:MAG TPA: ADP-ribosylglycohydrolase family protein [Mycobacteriales bacterium]|nr:ADP-ribosylglycohydrolase family protein [Mycobacteriales bacterium]